MGYLNNERNTSDDGESRESEEDVTEGRGTHDPPAR